MSPHGVEARALVARLVGTRRERIVAEAERLLCDATVRQHRVAATNPCGDGHAAEAIVQTTSGSPAKIGRDHFGQQPWIVLAVDSKVR